jgi:hypothetical protein
MSERILLSPARAGDPPIEVDIPIPIERFACGVCGKPSTTMFAYGYRCDAHKLQRLPSQMTDGGNVIVCGGVLIEQWAEAQEKKPGACLATPGSGEVDATAL